ncbi:quinone-dependent dihydroorotate dehydrogenase [Steroidobacter sp. S1-65]|uniref:Dihydroorotate dehydrogenase (quinone) n=1 Tax=Steroidobacter gossypii TaxID=2805490 RepID=A0ABS1X5E0_9GAMM|nr:quinone-dependent dihydroorotate dehydrogenase [Steroidobacter gossypii]
MYPLVRPILFSMDGERAHAVTFQMLEMAHTLGMLGGHESKAQDAVTLMGLRFPNRVGLAAGLDKNAKHIDALGALGFGFIEAGTVTAQPQTGNATPRLFRLPEVQALINRMGFPNEGAEAIAQRLASRTFAGPCGINIGKNAVTPLEDAARNYVECFRVVAPHADYVTVNVSSPNTANLRQLQQVDQLRPILDALLEARVQLTSSTGRALPILVKVSPDLTSEDFAAIARLVRELRIDGMIATNTTITRDAVKGVKNSEQQGGLSGAPIRPLALKSIPVLREHLGAQVPLIAAGGIDSGEAAVAALQAGADLIQIYTGLIYRGPRLVKEIVAAVAAFTRSARPAANPG